MQCKGHIFLKFANSVRKTKTVRSLSLQHALFRMSCTILPSLKLWKQLGKELLILEVLCCTKVTFLFVGLFIWSKMI